MKSQKYKGELYQKVRWRNTLSGRIYERLHSSNSFLGKLYKSTFICPIYPNLDDKALLNKICSKESLILDIGGNVGSFDMRKYKNYFRLDIDDSARPDIVGDALCLPLKDNSTDIIIAKAIFEHIKDPFQTVREIRRVLKKGGILFTLVPFYYRIHASPRDYYRFTKDGLYYLLKDFKHTEVKPCGGYITSLGNCFFTGTYALDTLFGMGFLIRVLAWPILRTLTYLDAFDKFNLTATYFYSVSVK